MCITEKNKGKKDKRKTKRGRRENKMKIVESSHAQVINGPEMVEERNKHNH